MDYIDNFNPAISDCDVLSEKSATQLAIIKSQDRGHVTIKRLVSRAGKMKKTKIDLYTTSTIGSNIRNAESGQYYNKLVGSKDEDLFFKVILATGECRSKNGSTTLFYNSPQQCMSHLNIVIDAKLITNWEEKRNRRSKVTST